MRNYRITSIWGIPIKINISLIVFLPVLAWLIGSGEQIALYADLIEGIADVQLNRAELRAGSTPWVIGAAAALGLFVSVLVHELGHSWVALRYDIDIDSITLWIFGGVASLRSIPREWNREFWIAIAGPVTSILLGVLCYGGLFVVPESAAVAVFVVGWLGIVNVSLAIFNMVPAFPMDGGRVLRALLARRRPYAQATRTAARVGVLFAIVFAILGVFANLLLILIALFIYAAATSESRMVVAEELLRGLRVGDVMDREPETVPAGTSLGELVDVMFRTRHTQFVVEDAGEPIGVVSLEDIRTAGNVDRDTTTVREIVTESPVRLAADADAFQALMALQRSDHALVEENGRVVGVLTRNDLGSAMTLRESAGDRPEVPTV